MGDVMGKIMDKPFDLLLGRRTYDIFAGYWPNAGDEPGAKPLNDATKYVVSASHPSLGWGPARAHRRRRACPDLGAQGE